MRIRGIDISTVRLSTAHTTGTPSIPQSTQPPITTTADHSTINRTVPATTPLSITTVPDTTVTTALPYPTPCPDVYCTNWCQYGYLIDDNNCTTCLCEDPCKVMQLHCKLQHTYLINN